MKKTILQKAVFTMLCCIVTLFQVVQAQTTYTFNNYPMGVQYAIEEEHVLDNIMTLYTTQCHFTGELRVYSSSEHNGFFYCNLQPYYIESITFNMGYKNDVVNIYGSNDNTTWNLVGTLPSSANYSNQTINFGDANYAQFKFDVAGTQQVRVKNMTINYKNSGPGNAAQMPVFSENSGIYTEPFALTLSCSTEGASIYYTLDGSTPDATSTLYTAPITISQTTTVKAIAYATNMNHSIIASATYQFPMVVPTIADFKNITPSDQPYTIGNDVTVVYQNGAYHYVKDASAGLLIYGNSFPMYTEGDQISSVTGTLSIYSGQKELMPSLAPGAASANTGAVAPVVVTLADLTANYNSYDAQLITLENVTFPQGYYPTSAHKSDTITQGGHKIVVYNRFGLDTTLAAGTTTNVTGFAAIYNSNIQIYPRNNNDLAPQTPTPSLAINTPISGSNFSTLDTLHVDINLQNFVLGTDGLLKIESELLTFVNLPSPSYFDNVAWSNFQNVVLSPLPAGTFTATLSLVDFNQQPLTPAVSATTQFTVTAPQLEMPVITISGNPEGSANTYYLSASALITAAEDATIYYTTDGTTPTTDASIYTTPIDITTTSTINAIAVKAHYANSEVATAEVIIAIPTVEAPTFTPATGTYADSVVFTLACANNEATIRYTTDGTEPNSNATIYSAPITLYATTTVKAKAFFANWNESETSTATYTIAHEPALAASTNTLSFNSNTLSQNFELTSAFLTAPIALSCNNSHFTLSHTSLPDNTTNATITVTFDGTESTTGVVLITSDNLSAEVTLSATAMLPTPTINPINGSTDTSLTITLACAQTDAAIYYTTDGTTPDAQATLYVAPFTLNTPGTYTVNAIAMQSGWENSAIATANYTITAPVVIPTIMDTLAYFTGFERAEGFNLGNVYNNASEEVNGPESNPWGITFGTVSSTSPISDSSSLQMRWYVASASTLGSARTTFDIAHATRITFDAKSTNGLNLLASYSTDGGNNYTDTLFTLASTANTYQWIISETAEYDNVRFKFAIALPETAPTGTSRVYVDNVSIFNFPSIISGTVEMPVITPNSAVVYEPTTVSINCVTENATIYYTTDGTEPTENANLYTGSFVVNTTTTIKAIAMKEGYSNSNVATVTYTFPVEVASIADFKNANSATNNTVYKINNDVTFVYRNGKNIYIQDATGGLLIYDNTSVITNNYNEGDVISNGICGTYTLYSGLVEMIPTRNTAAASSNTGTVIPTIASVEDIAAFYYQYESKLVKIENVTFPDGGAFTTASATNANIEQAGESMQVRNTFKTLDMTLPAGYQADVIGFVLQYNGNYQIAPRNNNDIIAHTEVLDTTETPEISVVKLTNDMYAVSITCSTPNAVIYYTMDGSEPTENATLYTGDFTTEGGNTIKAMAVAEGMANSAVATYANVHVQDYTQCTSLYPNPTHGFIYLQNNKYTIQQIDLYDATSKHLETLIVNEFSTSLNLQKYRPGTYFLRILTSNGVENQKILVR